MNLCWNLRFLFNPPFHLCVLEFFPPPPLQKSCVRPWFRETGFCLKLIVWNKLVIGPPSKKFWEGTMHLQGRIQTFFILKFQNLIFFSSVLALFLFLWVRYIVFRKALIQKFNTSFLLKNKLCEFYNTTNSKGYF